MWGQHVEKKRVLILGGGFGGVAAAQHLRKLFKKDPGVEITLVNRENFFVFIPLLASAASGSIETLHILNPIRRMIPGIPFRAEEVTDIDLQRRLAGFFSDGGILFADHRARGLVAIEAAQHRKRNPAVPIDRARVAVTVGITGRA